MRKIWRDFWIGVAVTVVGGVILAIVLAEYHHLFDVWEGIVWFAASAWYVITYSVPTPAIVLCLLVVVTLYFSWRLVAVSVWRRWFARSSEPVPLPLPQLSEDEDQVIRALAEADGRRLFVKQIAAAMGVKNLRAEQAVHTLTRTGFLSDSLAKSGALFRLSSRGRRYAIDKGYIR